MNIFSLMNVNIRLQRIDFKQLYNSRKVLYGLDRIQPDLLLLIGFEVTQFSKDFYFYIFSFKVFQRFDSEGLSYGKRNEFVYIFASCQRIQIFIRPWHTLICLVSATIINLDIWVKKG